MDVGGERSASAVAWLTEDLRVDRAIFTGNEAVIACAAKVRELAQEYTTADVTADPWRFTQSMIELAERGLPVTEFPQSNARMGPASERLHAAIVERRLSHRDDWRLDKLKSRDNIDAVVALATVVQSAESPTPAVEPLGWL